jgi:Protein of unknown function (DUF402)
LVAFEPGELVFRRHFMRDDLLARAWVGRVVSDDERGLLLWVPDGSPYKNIGAADGRKFRQVPFAEWGATAKALETLPWHGSALMLHPPGDPWSVWLWCGPSGFRGWYVNLELPAVRWAGGVDTIDYDLDVVVAPDRSWRWKDEDEFAAHLAVPDTYWVDDEAAVRADGWRAVERIEAGAFPFDGTWTDFVPDPSWAVPVELPAGWDAPAAWFRPIPPPA